MRLREKPFATISGSRGKRFFGFEGSWCLSDDRSDMHDALCAPSLCFGSVCDGSNGRPLGMILYGPDEAVLLKTAREIEQPGEPIELPKTIL